MPIVLAPFVAISLGALLAMALPSERSADERRARRIGWLYALLSLAPNFAYFLCLAPDWSVGYLVHASRVPSAGLLVGAVAIACLAPLSQDVALSWVRAGQTRRALLLSFVAASAALIAAGASAHRLWLVGTYAEFHGGGAMTALGESARGLAIVIFDALGAAGLVAALSRPESRRRRTESSLTNAASEGTLPPWTTRPLQGHPAPRGRSPKRAPSSSSSAQT